MDNEKAKRNRNAYKAFVQKTMEGATRISYSYNHQRTGLQHKKKTMDKKKAKWIRNAIRAFVQKTPTQTKIQKGNNHILISDLP